MTCEEKIDNILKNKVDIKKYAHGRKSSNVKIKSLSRKEMEKQEEDKNFSPRGVLPTMIINLFTDKNGNDKGKRKDILDGETGKTTVKDVLTDGREVTPSIWNKVKGLANISLKDMTAFPKVSDPGRKNDITGLEAMQVGIALNQLLGSVSTEFDLKDKYALSDKEWRTIMPKGEVAPGLSANGTAAAIGRQVMAAQGFVFMPKRNKDRKGQDVFDVEKLYTDVGFKAIELLEKKGFLDIEKPTKTHTPMVVNQDYRKITGNNLAKSKTIPGIVIRLNMDKLLNIESMDDLSDVDRNLVEKYLRKQTNTVEDSYVADRFPTLVANSRAATFMQRLVTPSNLALPDDTANGTDNSKHDVKVSKRTKNTLNQKNAGALEVPPDLEELFDFIYEDMASQNITFEEAARNLGNKQYKELFGFSTEVDSTSATIDSDMGKSLSKTTPVTQFFDNYGLMKKDGDMLPMHLQEEVKRNGRGHYMTTTLNPQTDKFFSRYIMQIPEYTIPAIRRGKTTPVFGHLLQGIADQSGLSVDEILNKGENPNLDKILASYNYIENLKSNKGRATLDFLTRAFSNNPTDLEGSPWQKYDSIKAIYQVRKMLADGSNDFSGTFMPKPDGTASGAVIMSMQMIGKNADNASLYEALGLDGDNEGVLKDAWAVTQGAITDELSRAEKSGLPSEMTDTFNFMLDNNIFSNIRNIAKEAAMPVMYSQGETSSKHTVANKFTDATYRALEKRGTNRHAIAEKVADWIDADNMNEALSQSILDDKGDRLKGMKLVNALLSDENSRDVREAIYNHMHSDTAESLYALVLDQFTNKYLSEYKAKTAEIFKEMARLDDKSDGSHRTTLIPPEVVYDSTLAKYRKKHGENAPFDVTKFEPLTEAEMESLAKGNRGVPLVKLFQTVQHPKENATVSRMEFLHKVNADVNIVHAIDFAILNEAFARTFEEADLDSDSKNTLLKNLELVKNGTVSVHDAISAHPVFSQAYEKHYREAARDINAVYDIHDQMTFELSRMPGYAENANQALRAETKTAAEEKRKTLETMNTNGKKVFGFEDLTMREGDLPKGQALATTKEKTEARAEVEKNREENAKDEMLTSHISKEDGEYQYKRVKDVLKKTHVVLDTETVGDDTTPANQIDPSLPYQVAFNLVEVKDGKQSKPVPYEFWFDHEPSKQVKDWMKNDQETIIENKIADKTNGKDNKETFNEMMDVLKKIPITAFNAEFDIGSMRLLYKKYGREGEFNKAINDSAAAAAHYSYVVKDQGDGNGNRLTSVYPRVTEGQGKINTKDAHDAMVDVNMTTEINDVLNKAPEPKTEPVLKTIDKPTTTKKNPNFISDVVKGIAKGSQVVSDFIANNNINSISYAKNGEGSTYNPSGHTIALVNSAENQADLTRALEHEIAHYHTVGYLENLIGDAKTADDIKDIDIKVLAKTIERIKGNDKIRGKIYGKRNKELFDHFTDNDSILENVAEMLAIMKTEPEFAKEMDRVLNQKTLPGRINRIFRKIAAFVTGKEFKDYSFNPEQMINSIDRIIDAGKDFNKDDKKKAFDARQKSTYRLNPDKVLHSPVGRTKLNKNSSYNRKANPDYVTNDPINQIVTEANEYVANLLYLHLGDNAESLAKQGAKAVDAYLSDVSQTYVDMKDTLGSVWDSGAMQEIKAYLAPGSISNRDDFMRFAKAMDGINQEHGKVTSTEVKKLDNLMIGMTKKEVEMLNDIFSLAPISDLMSNDGILMRLADGTTTIKEEIERIESKTQSEDIRAARDFANLYMDGNPTGVHYNKAQLATTQKRMPNLDQLTALYSLEKIDGSEKMLKTLYRDKNKLFNELMEKALANRSMTDITYNETGDERRDRGNMVLDYFEEPIEIKVVSAQEEKTGDNDSADEWKTIIPAKDNHGYAVMYKKSGIKQYSEGFGTNVDYGSTDVYMPKDFKPKGKNMDHLVQFGSGKNARYKVVIPMDIKKKELKLIQNPAQTLLRSYAHIQKVRESQAIRNEIMTNTGVLKHIESNDPRDTKEMEEISKKRGEDEPYFLKLGRDVVYKDLPKAIKDRYKRIDVHVSSVGQFNSSVSLVRKDIAPWAVGYQRAQPFKDIPMLRDISEIVTQAIALMKIHMIIVNPAKVTLDAISTTTLLVSNGVSPVTVAKGWKRNIPLMNSMAKLRAEQVDLTIRSMGGDVKARNDLKEVEKKLADHPLMGAINAGVIQSLTTDIITRDYDTITGLQRNIEKVFNNLTHYKDGNPNKIHAAVVALSTKGINIEDFFHKFANMGKDTESFKYMAEELEIMGDRIAKIKKDEDVAKYLSEYFASPDSTLTRLGSVATTYPDAMSRIIYRDFLIAKTGKKESQLSDKEIQDINNQVSDFMPDYTFNPPMVLDATGRFFITPFVSFSARIQRVILNLAQKNPLTLFGSLILADALGVNAGNTPYHVVGSNYITRDEFINNVFTDLFSVQTVLPTNVLNFDIVDL